MKFKNNIFIIRHGQSRNNVLEIESGNMKTQEKYGLTDLGRAQIAANKAKVQNIDVIYSSPFRRTTESAEILSRLSGLPINFDDRIREFDIGVYDEKPYDLMEIYIHEPKNNIKEVPVLQGESWNGMYERVKNFLIDVDHQYEDQNILIVSHGSPCEAMVQIAKDENTGFGPFENLIKNGQIVKL